MKREAAAGATHATTAVLSIPMEETTQEEDKEEERGHLTNNHSHPSTRTTYKW